MSSHVITGKLGNIEYKYFTGDTAFLGMSFELPKTEKWKQKIDPLIAEFVRDYTVVVYDPNFYDRIRNSGDFYVITQEIFEKVFDGSFHLDNMRELSIRNCFLDRIRITPREDIKKENKSIIEFTIDHPDFDVCVHYRSSNDRFVDVLQRCDKIWFPRHQPGGVRLPMPGVEKLRRITWGQSVSNLISSSCKFVTDAWELASQKELPIM